MKVRFKPNNLLQSVTAIILTPCIRLKLLRWSNASLMRRVTTEFCVILWHIAMHKDISYWIGPLYLNSWQTWSKTLLYYGLFYLITSCVDAWDTGVTNRGMNNRLAAVLKSRRFRRYHNSWSGKFLFLLGREINRSADTWNLRNAEEEQYR